MKKPKLGDILEIPTAKGLAYAQYTHEHSQFGSVLRVFDTLFESRPDNFTSLVTGPVRFSTLFPLRASVRNGIVNIIGHHEIAKGNKRFPTFRDGLPEAGTKKVAVWWFWDGEREWRVGNITAEQRKLPIRSIWNYPMLVQRIEEGWRPETDRE
jgi:hypothetical protein